MKKLLQYHVVTLVPMIAILTLYVYNIIGVGLFALLFLVYAFVYRPVFDFQRLKEKGLVKKEDFLKSYGFIRFKYYYELMFQK